MITFKTAYYDLGCHDTHWFGFFNGMQNEAIILGISVEFHYEYAH